MGIIKDLVTEADGESFCPERVLLIIGALVFLGLAVFAVFHGKDFNAQDYGIGFGSLLGGGGAGIWAKGKAE